jgi:hypothetical protein
MKIYVAGSSNEIPRVRAVQARLRAMGHEITFDWTGPVEEFGGGSDLDIRRKRLYANRDLLAIREADTVIGLAGGPTVSAGLWFELGYALACVRHTDDNYIAAVIVVGSQHIFAAVCTQHDTDEQMLISLATQSRTL